MDRNLSASSGLRKHEMLLSACSLTDAQAQRFNNKGEKPLLIESFQQHFYSQPC
jgi:hypothetical protein